MHTAARPGNDGLVHKYHGREKYGHRCRLGRHVKVCHCHYSIQKQKVEVFYAESFEKP